MPTSSLPTPQQRVKVYEMCRDEWTDKGTGLCSGDVLDDGSGSLCAWLLVRSEENRSVVLLKAAVQGSIRFQKQQETLLVWSEPGRNDMALSFQDPEGCTCVCTFLVQAQKSVARDISVVVVTSTDEGDMSEVIAGPVEFPPEPTVDNLPEVLELLTTLVAFQFSRESLCAFLIGTDFIPALARVFTLSEKNRLIVQLHNLFRIVKLLFGLNESKVIERLITDESIYGIIGSLEYDPMFPEYKSNLRTHFRLDNKFKEVVPIQDTDILTKIHLTSRLQLLKDVLARFLDETTFAVMSSMIYFNQWTIVMALQSSDYFSKFFQLYIVPYPQHSTIKDRRDGVQFIHNISLSTKGFQTTQKQKTFTTLAEKGLFDLLQFAIADSNTKIKMLGTELLAVLIELDPQIVRSFVKAQIEYVTNTTWKPDTQIGTDSDDEMSEAKNSGQLEKEAKDDNTTDMKDLPPPSVGSESKISLDIFDPLPIESDEIPQTKDNSLLKSLVILFMSKTDIGLRLQVLESLKFMLDTTDADRRNSNVLRFPLINDLDSSTEQNDDLFITQFYERYAGHIFGIIRDASIELQDPIPIETPLKSRGSIPKISSRLTPQNRSLYEQVCDLLTFCIRTHGVKCQYFISGESRVQNNLHCGKNIDCWPRNSASGKAVESPKPKNSLSTEEQKLSKSPKDALSENQTDNKSLRPSLWRGIAALLLSSHQSIQLAALRCVRQAITLLDDSELDFECENYDVFFEDSNKSTPDNSESETESFGSNNSSPTGSKESNTNSPLSFSLDSLEESHYALQLISSGCLGALVDVLCRTCHKTNLVNSACLEVVAIIFQRAKGIIEAIGFESPAAWRISTIINSDSSLNGGDSSQESNETPFFKPKQEISFNSLAKLPGNIALACWLVITRGPDLKRLAMIQNDLSSPIINSIDSNMEKSGIKRVAAGRMDVLEELVNFVELVFMQNEKNALLKRHRQRQNMLNDNFTDGGYRSDESDSHAIDTVQSSAAAAAVAVAVGRGQINDGDDDDNDTTFHTTQLQKNLQEKKIYDSETGQNNFNHQKSSLSNVQDNSDYDEEMLKKPREKHSQVDTFECSTSDDTKRSRAEAQNPSLLAQDQAESNRSVRSEERGVDDLSSDDENPAASGATTESNAAKIDFNIQETDTQLSGKCDKTETGIQELPNLQNGHQKPLFGKDKYSQTYNSSAHLDNDTESLTNTSNNNNRINNYSEQETNGNDESIGNKTNYDNDTLMKDSVFFHSTNDNDLKASTPILNPTKSVNIVDDLGNKETQNSKSDSNTDQDSDKENQLSSSSLRAVVDPKKRSFTEDGEPFSDASTSHKFAKNR